MQLRLSRRIDDVATAGAWVMLAAVCAFLLLPLVIIAIMSFDSRAYLGQFPPPDLTWRWYARFFSSDYFLKGLKFSAIIASLATAISTAVGVAAALAITRSRRAVREALEALFLSPLVVPGVVLGVALLLFYARIGLGNHFSRLVGAHVLITFPYVVRTTLASLSGIQATLQEAAFSLGANERQTFWTVTLPLAKTGIAAGAIFAFAFSFDDVAVSLFLSDPDTYTLPVALISIMYANLDLTIAAAAVMQVLLVVTIVIVLDRLIGIERAVGSNLHRV